MITDFARNRTLWQTPDLLCKVPVRLILDHQIRRQAVGKGAYLARGTTGRRLPGQRERAVARLGDLAHQQVHVVHQAVDPDTTRVLVEAHGPVRNDLFVRIGIQLGQALQLFCRNLGKLGHILERVGLKLFLVLVEIDLAQLALVRVLRRFLAWIFRTQTIADVGRGLSEVDVLVDELPVHRILLHDVVGDVVEDRQIGLRLEDHAVVGQLKAAMLIGRQHVHFATRPRQTGIGETRPKNRVHLSHVGTPQHKCIGVLKVIITTHRLVRTEGTHEGPHCRGHTMARIRVDVVGTETCLPQLRCSITLPDGPLPGAKHADTRGNLLGRQVLIAFHILLERFLPLVGHHREGLFPGNRLELALLVIFATTHAQQRLGQPVFAIHDLGKEIALYTVQAFVYRGIRITLGGDNTTILGTDQDRATGSAETTCGLVPADAGIAFFGDRLHTRDGDASGRCSSCYRIGLDKFTACLLHFADS